MRKTVLIIGASGYLGSNLVRTLSKKHKVIAAFNQHIVHYAGKSSVVYTLSDREFMKRLFTLMNPDVMVYCAGINDFMECAKKIQLADAVNALGAISLSSAGDTVPHRLIYISSAYVYEGTRGNYDESDPVFPGTQFGKSKLAGENVIKGKATTYTIFRFSPLIGVGSIYYPSIFDKIRMKLQVGERVELPQDEFHNYLSIEKACEAIDWAIVNESKNEIYNLGGLTKLSWYDMGMRFANVLGFDENLIVPGKGQIDLAGDYSLNGSELIRQSNINPLLLEEAFDLFQKNLVL